MVKEYARPKKVRFQTFNFFVVNPTTSTNYCIHVYKCHILVYRSSPHGINNAMHVWGLGMRLKRWARIALSVSLVIPIITLRACKAKVIGSVVVVVVVSTTNLENVKMSEKYLHLVHTHSRGLCAFTGHAYRLYLPMPCAYAVYVSTARAHARSQNR